MAGRQKESRASSRISRSVIGAASSRPRAVATIRDSMSAPGRTGSAPLGNQLQMRRSTNRTARRCRILPGKGSQSGRRTRLLTSPSSSRKVWTAYASRRPIRPIDIEHEPGDDLQGELVHLLAQFKRIRRPAADPPMGVLDNQGSVALEVAGVEVRLHQRRNPAPGSSATTRPFPSIAPSETAHLAALLGKALRLVRILTDQLGTVDDDPEPTNAGRGEVPVLPSESRATPTTSRRRRPRRAAGPAPRSPSDAAGGGPGRAPRPDQRG